MEGLCCTHYALMHNQMEQNKMNGMLLVHFTWLFILYMFRFVIICLGLLYTHHHT